MTCLTYSVIVLYSFLWLIKSRSGTWNKPKFTVIYGLEKLSLCQKLQSRRALKMIFISIKNRNILLIVSCKLALEDESVSFILLPELRFPHERGRECFSNGTHPSGRCWYPGVRASPEPSPPAALLLLQLLSFLKQNYKNI